jgi:putative membrane protein
MRISSSYIASFFLAGLLSLLTIIFQNYEFLLYAITVVIFIVILYTTDQYFNYKKMGLWLFNVWLLLHILGGLASYQGVRFYDLILLDIVGDPYHILKYDQFVHFYCYVVMSILMWSVVDKITKHNASGIVVCMVTILAASSLGAINEVIEFLAVVMLNINGVGGYINTAIDLVANLFGAITGTLYMYTKYYKSDRY